METAIEQSSRQLGAFNGLAELEAWVNSLMLAEGERFLKEVPRASHLTDSSPLDINYYVRHRIEAVWRIWLTARTDALALAHMVTEDYDAARQWSRYSAEELDHDLLFLADLANHGLSAKQVRSIPPFHSTQLLVAEIERQTDEFGSLPAVAYSLFVEWNADRFSSTAVEKAETYLSYNHVAGAKRHAEFDLEESHFPMILDITGRLISKESNRLAVLERLVRDIAAHFRAYFTELDSSDWRAPISPGR